MITAKEYLSRLNCLNIMIKQKQKEVDDLRLIATATGGFSNSDIVKSSKTGDSLERKVIKYADLEREIDAEIDKYVQLKHEMINEIQSLKEAKHIDLLYKRYVENKRLKRIAKEMHYDYGRIRILHLESLDAFQHEVMNEINL